MQDVWFVFFNRNRTQIRILRYDDNGFWLMTKRLSRGHFSLPNSASVTTDSLTAAELSQILRGLTLYPENKMKKVA
jgi:transposase